MIVGIDASRAVSPHPTGTEMYSRRLIQALLSLGSGYHFRLYFRSAPAPDLFPGAELRVIPFPRLWTHLRLSWEMARRPPDLLFVPAHVLPPIRPPRTLVTVHDLGYLYFPRAHPLLQRLYLDLSTRWNARVATRVLADSEATKADLVARYGTPAAKVTVAYPGYDERLAPVRDPSAIAAVKTRYGIEGNYFLYLGTLQPRKNLARLIDAFARLRPEAARPAIYLVLAGRPGWLYRDLFGRVRRYGLEDRVLFLGYVPEADKPALLSGALALVFPSLYEGFGLPVLEAQACGCPVICSTAASLPEVAGGGALLVDPYDVEGWAEAMARLAEDPGLRADLVERGFVNLRRFSWHQCARTVLSVIDALSGHPVSPLDQSPGKG
ncbi:MAG TPA: glycosyltransferase family 1 protein [Chloroflexi bacterium]|nr:glycosyltransferase family 1 protein [Chloroflexota bacterium]